jgi:hypothetical protein
VNVGDAVSRGPGTVTVQVPGVAGTLPGWSVLVAGQPAGLASAVPVWDPFDPKPMVDVEVRFAWARDTARFEARMRTEVPVPRGAGVRVAVPVDALLPVALAISRRRRAERLEQAGQPAGDLLDELLDPLPLP